MHLAIVALLLNLLQCGLLVQTIGYNASMFREQPNLSKGNILLIDDDVFVLEMYAIKFATGLGYALDGPFAVRRRPHSPNARSRHECKAHDRLKRVDCQCHAQKDGVQLIIRRFQRAYELTHT
jgi:hypothetical protein